MTFSSRFNQSIKTKANSFLVPRTNHISIFLDFFRSQGYILAYKFEKSSTKSGNFRVYLNYNTIDFTLKNVWLPSRRSEIGSRALSYYYNSGYRYIIWVPSKNFYFLEDFKNLLGGGRCEIIFMLK
jgi:ribosomal protein S8